MNKTRYSATEFGRNKPMNFRPSGTLSNRTKEARPEDFVPNFDRYYYELVKRRGTFQAHLTYLLLIPY